MPYLDDYDAVLMENHGVLCWGSDVEQAYHRLETVEFCAQVTMTAELLGGARELPQEPLDNLLAVRKMMKRSRNKRRLIRSGSMLSASSFRKPGRHGGHSRSRPAIAPPSFSCPFSSNSLYNRLNY